jgi:hypothetical protein
VADSLPAPESCIVTPETTGPVTVPESEQFDAQLSTVKADALLVALATPSTVTTTLPVPVAVDGTVTVMLVELQLGLVTVPTRTPLTLTVLEPCACVVPKLVPVIVIVDPTGPALGFAWVTVGAASTDSVAVLLVAPVPPSAEVIALVVLVIVPPAVPVTLTVIVHDPPADSVPPDKFNDVELAVAPVTLPLQVFANAGDDATCRPPVSVSVNPTPLSVFEALGLLMVNVIVVDPPTATADVPNALLMVGGPITVSVKLCVALGVMPLFAVIDMG